MIGFGWFGEIGRLIDVGLQVVAFLLTVGLTRSRWCARERLRGGWLSLLAFAWISIFLGAWTTFEQSRAILLLVPIAMLIGCFAIRISQERVRRDLTIAVTVAIVNWGVPPLLGSAFDGFSLRSKRVMAVQSPDESFAADVVEATDGWDEHWQSVVLRPVSPFPDPTLWPERTVMILKPTLGVRGLRWNDPTHLIVETEPFSGRSRGHSAKLEQGVGGIKIDVRPAH